MTRAVDLARLLRDVIAAGTSHQLTLQEQQGDQGLLVRCSDADGLPAGVSSPYLDRPDSPGPFLVVDRAGSAPRKPQSPDYGEVSEEAERRYEQQLAAWRTHYELYNDLFGARTPPEQMELVIAVGLLEHEATSGQHYQRHLVVAPAEIELEQATQQLAVVASDAFRVEDTWMPGSLRSPLAGAIDERNNRPLLEVLADDAETIEQARATWRRACSVYGQDTLWEPTGSIPAGDVALFAAPVVLLRKKDTSHLLALLHRMVEDLESEGHVSGPLRMLVDMTAEVADLDVLNDAPALPKPANDEQRSMLDQARRSPHSIIQGPPGTGKTHTIANLAAVLMAEGRRVLITAENDRALREVQSKLPSDMQPLLLPLLKDKADSGLARSVTALIEEADKERRGARPDVEGSLVARRARLEDDATTTIQAVRQLDALEQQEHELNGTRMRLAGHMIALDNFRTELATADQYLSEQFAEPEDARALLELHPLVSQADRELAKLRLPEGLPDPVTFAQHLHTIREKLSQLPDRTDFDYATLGQQITDRLEGALTRLATLSPVPFSSIDLAAGDYRGLQVDATRARTDLNHGVTGTGAEPQEAEQYLAAYLALPACYIEEPAGLAELHQRAAVDADSPTTSVRLAASADPVAIHRQATQLASRFTTDPTGGLLARYVTDLRHRSDSSLRHLAEHAGQLAARIGLPPTLPISIASGAPADHELLDQARGLRDYLAGGGKMTKLMGTPRPVRDAGALIEHVTVAGSRVDTVEEAEAVADWLEHRIAVQMARHWAEQQDLTPPHTDVQLKDWLTALSRLPDEATGLNTELHALLQSCHVPAEAQTEPADVLTRGVLACAAARIVDELGDFAAARSQLGPAEIRIDGVPVHDRHQAQVAHGHFRSLVRRQAVAAKLPSAWTEVRELHDVAGDDRLAIACEVAAAAADLPGAARPQLLSEASIRDVLSRVHSDRRRDEVTDEHRTFLGGAKAALSICTPASPATELLGAAVREEDATSYRHAHAAHVDEAERAERASTVDSATTRLRRTHPALVAGFLSGDEQTHDVLQQLAHFQDLMVYRQEATALLKQYPDVRRLHEHLAEVRAEHLKVEAQLASARCWSRAVARLAADRQLSAALASLQKAERAVPKTKTAKTYQRKLRALRQATRTAAPAIPCWVMPIDKVAELIGYPTDQDDRFDVIIVDEASQAWFPTAFLYAIAEQVIVVGDDLQTSPSNTTVLPDEMDSLTRQHLPDHKLRDSLDNEFSLYDVAAAISPPTVMVDHFRCVPPIIELSNRLCYAQRGQRLLPVRVTEPGALEPIKHVRTPGRRAGAGGANLPEADAIVEQIVDCATDPAYDELTFGVVVVGPRPQAHIKHLRTKLLSALGGTKMQELAIEVGSPAQYQGAERNIMFLSLVETPDASGNIRAWPLELTGKNLRNIQALNVAVSRAQDQLWIFHSFGTENLKQNDARHVLLTPPAMDDAETIEAQLAKCDSDFERHVVVALAADPHVAKVRTQVEALGFFIDIVIESHDGRRLAVECDGDAWHTADADVARDLYRQRTLEAAGGWKFQRFLASEWYADSAYILEQTIAMLGAAPKAAEHADVADADADAADQQLETNDPITATSDPDGAAPPEFEPDEDDAPDGEGPTPEYEWRRSAGINEHGIGDESADQQDDIAVQERAGTDNAPATDPVPEVADGPDDAPEEQPALAPTPSAASSAPSQAKGSVRTLSDPEPADPTSAAGSDTSMGATHKTPLPPTAEATSNSPTTTPNRSESAASSPHLPGTAATGSETTDTLQLASRASALLAAGPVGLADLSARLGVDGVVFDEVLQLLESLGFTQDGETVREA